MKCPTCGKIYEDSSNFCMDCGCELVNDNEIIEVKPYFTPTIDPKVGSLDVQLVNSKISEYKQEANLADRVYKSYVTGGVSRLDKINGRFLASQTIKLDVIIEQNMQLIEQNRIIINLLEKISDK